MNKVYSRIFWKNYPSEDTPLNEKDLNQMDLGIDNLDNRLVEMDAVKVNKEVANNLVKTWSIDEETGIITVEHLDGSKDLFDLNIEKIPVDFKLSDYGILTMTTDDGTQYTANIGAMIPVLTFDDSDEIAVTVTGTGANKTYSFSIKAGSVTEDKIQPNFLADVKTEVAKAQASQSAAAQSASDASSSATLAESYTHGGTGAREGEDADNARYYMEQAKAVSAVNVATTETAGIVKPDGDTITVDPDGTIHGQSKVSEMTGATAEANGTSGTVPAPLAGQENHVLKGNGAWESLAYDSELSAESENAPQTKVVDAKTKEIEENLAQLSNPNLLINPDFRINQRGQTSWSGKDQYTVDRWRQLIDLNGTITKDDDGLLFDNTNGKISLGQFFENLSDFAGKTVTLSAKIMRLTDNVDGSIYIGGNSSVLTFKGLGGSLIKDEWVTLSITYTMPTELTNMLACIFVNDVVQTKIKVAWMKLEFGSVATPFVPPDPATELLKCQRYYQIYDGRFASGFAYDSNTLIFSMTYVTEMRTKPTVANNYNLTPLISGRYVPDIASFEFGQSSGKNCYSISAIKENTFTVGQGSILDGHIEFDAEIY